jgi:antitoxin component YwqK of YwqJK toxin-antitoxin module
MKYILICLLFISCNEKNIKQQVVKTFFSGTENVHTIVTKINDKSEGQEFIYYPNGNIRTITTYKNGLKEGWQYWFFESGVLDANRFWVKNKRNGYCTDYFDLTNYTKATLFYENDNLLLNQIYDTNGIVIKVEKSDGYIIK